MLHPQTGELPMQKTFNRSLIAVLTLIAGILLVSQARANIVTWTGADGTAPTNFEVSANWTGGVAPGIPRNNDYSDIARFALTSPANQTPTLTINRTVNGIRFDNSVGWTLGTAGKQLTLKTVESSGNGTNTVTAQLKTGQGNYDWTIGAGNTVNLVGGLIQDGSGRSLTLKGGGTMIVVGGINPAYSSAVNKFYIELGTLIVDTATPYRYGGNANNGLTYITTADGFLQMKTTVANAQNQIGTRIIDNVGNGLTVTDIGGGYVQVTSTLIPEPATLALLGLVGLCLLPSRRR